MSNKNIDPNTLKRRNVIPADTLIKHTFAGGRVEYTTGNKYQKVGIESFNKADPLDIVEFDIDPRELMDWKKIKPDRRPKLRMIKARIKGQKDRLTLDR